MSCMVTTILTDCECYKTGAVMMMMMMMMVLIILMMPPPLLLLMIVAIATVTLSATWTSTWPIFCPTLPRVVGTINV